MNSNEQLEIIPDSPDVDIIPPSRQSEGGSGRKKLWIIIAVILLTAAVAAAVIIIKRKKARKPAEPADGAEDGAEGGEKEEPGEAAAEDAEGAARTPEDTASDEDAVSANAVTGRGPAVRSAEAEAGDAVSKGKKKKKRSRRRSRLGLVLDVTAAMIFVAAIGLLIYVMWTTASGRPVSLFGRSFVKVVTGSMEPSIYEGDYIVIEKVDASELKEGDIITFFSDDDEIKGEIVTHRIYAITAEGVFETRGDANPISDHSRVTESGLIGRYTGKARFLRIIGSFAGGRKLIMAIAMVVALIACFFEAASMGRMLKASMAEKNSDREKRRKELEEKLAREAVAEYLASQEKDKGR